MAREGSRSIAPAERLSRTERLLSDLQRMHRDFLVGVSDVSRIMLIRHADSYQGLRGLPAGVIDPPISRAGVGQAELLARRLRQQVPHGLWSSDLLRARQTTAIIANATGLEPKWDRRLRERIGVNDYDDAHRSDAAEEPPESIVARMSAASVDAAVAASRLGGPIALITHAEAVQHLLSHLLGLPARLRILPGFTSVSVVLHHEGRFVVESIGDVSHLLQSEEHDPGRPASDRLAGTADRRGRSALETGRQP